MKISPPMDLGCLDLGCISLPDENQTPNISIDLPRCNGVGKKESVLATAKMGKYKSSKGSPQSNANGLNRLTSQIKKPPHRKTSPINWFPRKKVDSYLKRKIKLLQEAGGMNSSLDETLGDANPHYCRVEREKIAAREAARNAMEARKAAMVEASWCRILRAARIQSKEAEELLLQAEKHVAEAFEAATAKGVIMYDSLDCPRKQCVIETSSVNGKASTTFKASFETSFDVDKQVAAAVKTAFIRLANCPSLSKVEFKDILRKISENPDTAEHSQQLSAFQSDSESDTESEFELGSQEGDLNSQNLSNNVLETRSRKRQSPQKLSSEKLTDMMFERLKCLPEDELGSLATIVATCGLNAALAEVENHRPHDQSSGVSVNFTRRVSSCGVGTIRSSSMDHFMNGPTRKKQVETELPSLDKVLVKHMTKLEREVQEARNARKNELSEGNNQEKLVDLGVRDGSEDGTVSAETIPDLGSILVKHSSKLKKEIEDMKIKEEKVGDEMHAIKFGKGCQMKQEVTAVPSLDKFLVKHVSRLEREVQEAKNRRRDALVERCTADNLKKKGSLDEEQIGSMRKCNVNDRVTLEIEQNGGMANLAEESTMKCSDEPFDNKMGDKGRHKGGNLEEEESSLDKILVKPVHWLEREKMRALSRGRETGPIRYKKQQSDTSDMNSESLEKVLVKHISRLEKEKMEFGTKVEVLQAKMKYKAPQIAESEGGLDQILVKHRSKLEKEKMAADPQREDLIKCPVSRKEARERELQEIWGGMSLGNSIRPHVSRLERDKAAWLKAEEEERRAALQEV